jgi:hypothetical protein
MALLQHHVVLCTESIADPEQRARVIRELTDPDLNFKPKKLIDITYAEMLNMAGNMIMVRSALDGSEEGGKHVLIMSERARKNLRPEIIGELDSHYKIVAGELNMIETIGGGSARCMVAELF